MPQWSRLIGCSGAVELSTREYNGNTYNDVKRILPQDEAVRVLAEQLENEPKAPAFNFPGA